MSDLILTPQKRKELALSRVDSLKSCLESMPEHMFDHFYLYWYTRPDNSDQYLSHEGWGTGGLSVLPPGADDNG